MLLAIYASIALLAVLGTMAMHIMNGPVRAMSVVTKRTLAENNMMASGRLALMVSSKTPGDCDADGRIEPVEWIDPVSKPAPVNGGLLPATIGASLQDPWGNSYGYCAWDHGTIQQNIACGATARRLAGADVLTNPVIAIISSGPDRIFQTTCHAQGQGEYIVRSAASDDMVLSYSFAEAVAMSGGLWSLEPADPKTATIGKNLSVTDESGQEQFSFDAATKALSIGAGGTGQLPNIRTDFIQSLTANVPVEFLANIKSGAANITTAEANAVAAIVTSSGSSGVGLKAKGTSKAIEAEGLLDMTDNRIVNVATPTGDADAVTKKYVDDMVSNGSAVQRIRCESFVFTTCTGSVSHPNLTKTNLGACKKACEAAGVQCCEAEFSALPGNPNAALTACHGFNAPSQTSGGVRNLLTILLGGGKFVSALCYLE